MLQRDIVDFAKLSDVDKEKVMAFALKLAREEKDGSDIPDMRQAEDGSTDSGPEDGSESDTSQTKSGSESDDTTHRKKAKTKMKRNG